MAKTTMASETIEFKNKALALEAFDTVFTKREYAAAERFWSPNYIQHSAHHTTRSRRAVQSRPLSAGNDAL
jgi:predicted SnoaL-like aldol condensation-catalyzing enzyme